MPVTVYNFKGIKVGDTVSAQTTAGKISIRVTKIIQGDSDTARIFGKGLKSGKEYNLSDSQIISNQSFTTGAARATQAIANMAARSGVKIKNAETWGVFSEGGSIGSKNTGQPIATGSEEEMKAKAKRMTASLSPGERKYYGIKYVARKV